jgi:hypothetical protein
MLKIGQRIQQQETLITSDTYFDPLHVISETLDETKYTDITSNEAWMSVGVSMYDYLFCRKQVMYRTAIIGFSGLTTEEKICASRHFAVDKPSRDSVHTEQQQMANWNVFVDLSKQIRYERWVKAKAYISYQLSPAESTDLALNTETLSKNFVEYGIEAMSIDGVEGIYDWLENTYPTKLYYNSTHKDNIMSILTLGYM